MLHSQPCYLLLFRMCLSYSFLSKTDVFCVAWVLLLFWFFYPPLSLLNQISSCTLFLDLTEKPACSLRIMSACVISWQVSLGFYSRSIRWFRLGSTKTGYTSEGIQTICGASSKTAAKKSKGMSLSSSSAFHWKLPCTVTYSTVWFWIFFIFFF